VNKKYLVILTGLFLLRFVNINQSFWLDEAITAQKTKTLGFVELVTKYSVADFHPPLHYFVVKIFGDLLGYSELSVRLPSIIACFFAAFFIYKMAGRWASLLFLANPLIFYYSQEGRMYMLACAFLLATWYGVSRNKWWANIFAALSIFTFYGSGFFLLALFFVYKKQRRLFLPGAIIALTILFPLLSKQVANSQIALDQVGNWSLVLGKVEFKNLVLIPLKFFTGRVSFYPKALYFIIGGIWSFGLFFLAFWKSKKTLIVVPLLIALIISFWAPMLQYFRYIYLIPVLCIGLARYGHKLRSIALLGSLVWCLVYVGDINTWREDWKGFSQKIEKGSAIILPMNFADPISFYRPNLQIIDIQTISTLPVVYSTPYGMDIMGIKYASKMEGMGYKKIQEYSFRGIQLDEWKKN